MLASFVLRSLILPCILLKVVSGISVTEPEGYIVIARIGISMCTCDIFIKLRAIIFSDFRLDHFTFQGRWVLGIFTDV